MRIRFLLARGLPLTTLVLGLVACGDDNFGNPTSVTDSSGLVFAWRCHADGCDPTSDVAPTTTCGSKVSDGYAYSRRRFVRICPTYTSGIGWSTDDFQCRLLTCERSSECPRWDDTTYVCENGLCQARDHDATIRRTEMRSLCLDDRPRDADCSAEASDPELMAIEADLSAACGGSGSDPVCSSVPAGCRVP